MRPENALLSRLLHNIRRTSRAVPTHLASFSNQSLPSARHHRQGQAGVSSVPTSLFPMARLAQGTMAPDCTGAGGDGMEGRALTKGGLNGSENVPTEALKGAGPLRLAASTQHGLLLARQESRESKARPSGQAAQSSGGTEFTRLELSRDPGKGPRQGRIAGSCCPGNRIPGDCPWGVATCPPAL